jgi:hypothetical protein
VKESSHDVKESSHDVKESSHDVKESSHDVKESSHDVEESRPYGFDSKTVLDESSHVVSSRFDVGSRSRDDR